MSSVEDPSTSTQQFEDLSVETAPLIGGSIAPMSELEKAAFYLAIGFFSVVTLATLWILYDWHNRQILEPTMKGLPLDQQRQLIENFKAYSEVAWDHTSKIFDLIVVKAFLPVLATLVGFLIGKRSDN